MRRIPLIAAAAAIAFVGLSAAKCGGGSEEQAAPAAPAEEMPAKPDESMSDDTGMSDDSMSNPNNDTVDEIPADE
jgi:hypothetical protein